MANRIGFDKRTVNDSNNYQKIAAFCRKMEVSYHLKQVLSPKRYLTAEQRNIPRMDVRKETLKANIKGCLSASKTYNEFESRMKQKGYEIIKGRGISFIDKQAVKVKGSEVGYSLQKIEKILNLQEQLQHVREAKNREYIIKPGINYQLLLKDFIQQQDHLKEQENFLIKTIEVLLSSTHDNNYIPYELKQKAVEKKKKRHLSQHH